MTEERDPPRRPFGERDDEEPRAPFGTQPPRQRPTAPAPSEPDDYDDLAFDERAGEWDALPEEPALDDGALFEGEEALPQSVPDLGHQGSPDAPALIRSSEREGPTPQAGAGDQPPAEAGAVAPLPGAQAAPATQPVIRFGVLLRAMGTIFAVAAGVATMFTWWTPNTFLPADSVDQLSIALATQSSFAAVAPPSPVPAIVPTEGPLNTVGIVSGHRGLHPTTGLPDPGAVCEDGLTEAEINETIAERVAKLLHDSGYTVDVFDEFDPRLHGYRALAMISIHADSCEYINDLATGFKVASFAESSTPDEDARLVRCLIDRYAATTGLTFHPSVTFDMTQYHTFREVAPGSPGAIMEVGFMYLDRELLTGNPDQVALGVARGVLCFLRNEPIGDEPDEPDDTPPTATRVP